MSPFSRRDFLVASTLGVAGYRFGTSAFGAAGSSAIPERARPAKSTILFFLCGGASHVDMWDLKPDAPSEYRSAFLPIRTSAPDIRLCEHLPMTAKVAHRLAIVRSVSDFGRATGDHHAGYYYNLTGHAPDPTFRTQGNNRRPYPDDWPFMGSVVGLRRPPHPELPSVITLPHKPSRAPYTRPGQFSGKLGPLHDPIYLNGSEAEPMRFTAPSLTLQTSAGRLEERRGLLAALDDARAEFDHNAAARDLDAYQDKAFTLLSSASTSTAFDLASEPEKIRERYGKTVNGMSLLMARRLVEAGVPFVTVFWKENQAIKDKCRSAGGWDTHGNNFNCLRDFLLPEFDRAYSALIEDLAGRGLLDETLVLVSSEMGRKPLIGDRRSGGVNGAGRDHWTACMSNILAGGGVRGGQVYGSTDARGEYPDESPVGPEDITKTVYHAMGVTDLRAKDRADRPINLLAEGRPLTELF
ncbi:MAG: DUF1501 domain-containing protein [Verrucomicrobiae bacterium]|nr:DUF1501 domain-containing protein [Verrucomicrobiae bacterium]MCP5538653.1 DUF1501 domain-containing protein [Akkermansiaceae bacterium]MCP5550886.1 DUF1501 domain-containing protein [Akkermansiaceae bacterium]